MSDEIDEVMQAVNERLESLEGTPKVTEVQTERSLDSNGNPAAFLTVIVEDQASKEPYSWPRLKPIHDLIWTVFIERAVAFRPYIDFMLRSEVGQDDEAELSS